MIAERESVRRSERGGCTKSTDTIRPVYVQAQTDDAALKDYLILRLELVTVFFIVSLFLKLVKCLIPTSALPIRESEPPLLDCSVGSLKEDILDVEFVLFMQLFNWDILCYRCKSYTKIRIFFEIYKCPRNLSDEALTIIKYRRHHGLHANIIHLLGELSEDFYNIFSMQALYC